MKASIPLQPNYRNDPCSVPPPCHFYLCITQLQILKVSELLPTLPFLQEGAYFCFPWPLCVLQCHV